MLRKNIKQLFAVSVIAALLALLVYFIQRYYRRQLSVPETSYPAAFSDNVSTIHFTLKGQAHYQIDATQVLRYTHPKHDLLANPNAKLFVNDGPYWQVTADTATVNGNQTQIDLVGHVVVHRERGKKNKAVTLTTSELTVLPKQNIAYNHKPTKAFEQGLSIEAIGVYANLNKNKIRLLSKAKATVDNSN